MLRARIAWPCRVLLALAVTAWLAAGLSGTYAYVSNYALRRGFPALATPAGIPRGTLETVRFFSPAIGRPERYLVYLPPRYAAEARRGRRFPVMYLLHGAPGTMSSFTNIGAIDVRANTLIARHRIRPLILVMPGGQQGLHDDNEWANTRAGRWMDFVLDAVRDVDRRFATLGSRRYRAIAGASEGAYGALNIGLRHLARFSIIESWSGYFTQIPTGPFSHASPAQLAANSPAAYVPSLAGAIHRRGLRAWLLQGRTDWRSPAAIRGFAAELHAAGADVRYGFFPGGHDWGLWRAQIPRMLIAASRWFGRRPGAHAGFGHVGRALSRAQRLRIRRRRCLALHPGPHVHIHPACLAYRARHGLGRPRRRSAHARRAVSILTRTSLMPVAFTRRSIRAVAASAAAAGALAATAAPAPAAAPKPVTPGSTYLALGDSVTFGYMEPQVVPAPDYARAASFVAYPEMLGAELHLRVVNAACPGETSASLVNASAPSNGCENAPTPAQTAYRRHYPLHVRYSGSQLAYAVRFLRTHRNTRLVTLMIGANDAFLCQRNTSDGCASPAERRATSARITANVRRILSAIRRKARYRGQLVIVKYYSLDYNLANVNGQSSSLNQAMLAAARPYRVTSADGFGTWKSAARRSGRSTCDAGLLTQLGRPGVCGIHPSYAGQALLAQALLKAIRI